MASLNWLELPSHIHALVMNKLASITDYIHFGVVCRSWHYVFDHYIQLEKIPRPQLPLLLIPSSSSSTSLPSSSSSSPSPPPTDEKKEGNAEEKRSVFSVSQRKVYDLEIKLPYNRHCRGSSHGWLITVEEDRDFTVQLLNPFLSVDNEIQLPPLKTLCINGDTVRDCTFLKRTILSKEPRSSSNTKDNNDHDCLVVVAILGQDDRLAFCKPGDESWICLPYDQLLTGLADVTYYKGMLYTVAWRGEVVAFDIHAFITSTRIDHASHCDLKPKVVIRTVAPSPLNYYGGLAKYIVESSGNLLQVQRFYNPDGDSSRKTIKFQVFKLLNEEARAEEKYCKWEEVKSLQGHSLFLGDNGSMSLSAAEFSGCMPNCIYFTDDYFDKCYNDHGAEDFGVFNLEDGIVELHYTIQPETLIWPPPIWVQPTANTSTARDS